MIIYQFLNHILAAIVLDHIYSQLHNFEINMYKIKLMKNANTQINKSKLLIYLFKILQNVKIPNKNNRNDMFNCLCCFNKLPIL